MQARDPAALGITGPPPDPADWWQVITEPADPGELPKVLPDVEWVLPGDESAVPWAEDWAFEIGAPGNYPVTSAQRTRKTHMQYALAAASPKVAGPVTLPATTLQEAQAAASKIGWPVVIKPDWSASSVGVRVCRTPTALTAAWPQVWGMPGALGEITSVVAVQEYLAGQKWTVDTITVSGADGRPVHVATSFWCERVVETPAGIAWGESWFVPPSTANAPGPPRRVAAYVFKVLDAVWVEWGPACTEVVLTARGPRLTEVMARLAGCYPVHLVELVTGQSQVTSTVDALIDPAALARRDPAAGNGRTVAQVWLAAPYDGWLNDGPLCQILNLPTVQTYPDELMPGAEVHKTIDSTRSPGRLDLLGPRAQVEQDIGTIRTLEHSLYRRQP
ncbi:MAG: hypothetical protein ACRDNF_01375 [Streptosporangiaceae bacterium]